MTKQRGWGKQNFNLVIISCSTCCLFGPVKATWVCAIFDSNLVIISCHQQVLQLMMTRLESKLSQTHVALTGSTRQQVLQLMMTRLESKLSQTHVALTGPTRQQVLQLMITRLESKLAQTHVALIGPTRQQVL